MKVKTWMNICKGVAIAQAIMAPGLMVIGLVTKKPKLIGVGAVWCGWVTLDTARTACDALDNVQKVYHAEDDDDVFDNKFSD